MTDNPIRPFWTEESLRAAADFAAAERVRRSDQRPAKHGVQVSRVDDLRLDKTAYDGTAVVEVESDLGSLTIKVPFRQQTSVDDGISDALRQVKAFALALHDTISE